MTLLDKIHGSLAAACVADALGAPTEEWSIAEIPRLFGGRVESFHAPLPTAPYAKGRSAAQITDDSSQMLMLAEAFAANDGEVSPETMAELLIRWSGNPDYYPHFAGPTTRAAIDRLKAGDDPWIVGKEGATMSVGASNGGAMRVAPAGLVHPGDVEGAVRAAQLTCVPSHNTSIGVAGAAAIAAAVAWACVDGVTVLDVVRAARHGAELGEELGAREGRLVPGPSVSERIDLAVSLAIRSRDVDDAVQKISDLVGTGLPAAEACPAAIGFFVAAQGDPFVTAVLAANAGGDSDTIGCMAASISGALTGRGGVPDDLVSQVEEANDLHLLDVAERLHAVVRGR
ncbi:ADP-ribosylglycohydrolase family protein [Agromyces aerolatus]|uniref:ADP-ribosylglycohydrolase family protein n=1 Tax=Agromyces sp. LY-1074 TaxID=3074080 RepID=UPI0028599080|nr:MULTISPECIES: ADP-ribosylglycohydrolase family protein [unclassified Agromyces]MDR5700881.1 ADP-ribosylglycohydrolase family protein [Agromyces sp. LY-1074]MDR5707458.1 ADP-ribosylglycohydrolase family protein [Agromyces sp. LY-1358]